ncbi:carbohydrate ABC transporter permease [Streptomyces iranensis]|uniref:Binding-protein-dependent transport systemsinner membrane component n=1 Tax=Streptomyces iranensis TaxID=576784 RepID=A0A060ZBP3_9ACTN|nr:sugar ABC transporter permease [Streptomyces iranensis]MBP2063351.1 raffinose/stachyose/melibiose transport system permease protein [Streptomyces iranensis]CDR01706.1 binding-protein-dependent transport systemsinner membrane component [Streptomyces iranensis]
MTISESTAAAGAGPDVSRIPAPHRPGVLARLRDRRVSGWLFLLPLIAFNLFVVLVPSAFSVWYSFTDWTGISSKANFIGLENYRNLLRDPEFVQGLEHNVLWTVFFLIVPMAMGLFGAYALSRIRRFRLLFRTLYFIPYIVASVVNASIWRSILDPQNGLGNLLHINPLGDQHLALWSVEFVNNWAWWGFLVVVFLAAMQGVNPSLYEAATMDGAGATRQFFAVTLPAIRPTFAFLGLMTIIWSFLAFDYVYILTQGGPAGSTDLLSTVAYRNAFSNLQGGYASATGIVMAFISGVVVTVYLVIRKTREWET